LSEKLNLNGYFICADSTGRRKDHRFNLVIFFEDGMFVNCRENNCGSWQTTLDDNFRAIDSKRQVNERFASFHESNDWGYYKVFGDTIIEVQMISRPPVGGMARFWGAYGLSLKIVDRNTLQPAMIRTIHKLPVGMPRPLNDRLTQEAPPLMFIPIEPTLSSAGWLKYEKWFWENESAFKTWVQEHPEWSTDH
jgi:hypothetical protein